jgi:apyrase
MQAAGSNRGRQRSLGHCFSSPTYPSHHYSAFRSGGDVVEVTGIAEMGGASLQITFPVVQPAAAAAAAPYLERLALPHTAVHSCTLFTHSLPGFGREAAFSAVTSGGRPAAAACMPNGYPLSQGGEGTGSWELCSALVSTLLVRGPSMETPQLSESDCDLANCSHAAMVSGGMLQASRDAFQGSLVATENFARTVMLLGLGEDATLSEVAEAGAATCAMPWQKVLEVRQATVWHGGLRLLYSAG